MKTTRRRFVTLLGVAGAGVALGGCEEADRLAAMLARVDPDADFSPPTGEAIDLVAHVLGRVTWGTRPGLYRRVSAMGVDAFIEEQLAHEAIDDRACRRRVASIESLHQPTAELYEYNEGELLVDLARNKLLRAIYSRRQLFEVMVDFWTDHFNIVSQKGDCRWLKAADDRDVIRAHALGRFRDLVRASAMSPAMLIYLDGHDNKVEQPGDRPNENYARELLELHTLGVHGGYTQDDVMEVARCLSGWTYANRPFRFNLRDMMSETGEWQGPFEFHGARVAFDPSRHDDGAKHVLGQAIPAGGGADDLERVLDVVCAHPATARHVATRLVRRFVADPAPDEVVETVAGAFQDSAGDIRATLRAMFGSASFRESRGTLVKRPLRYVVSALRATDARTACSPEMLEALARMGHAPFQYPTPDGYPIEAQPWLGTLLWRWNFALGLQNGQLHRTSLDVNALEQRLGGPDGLAAHLLGRLPSALEHEMLAGGDDALALLLASPAFQRH